MKNSVRSLGAAILTAIFCLAVSIVSGSPKATDQAYQGTIEQGQILAANSDRLFCLISQPENLVNGFRSISGPISKRSLDKLYSIAEYIEELFESKFGQYHDCSVDFRIALRKSDIIFPFHYFW